MRRILVTGGCGFIGHHLVQGLLDRGDDVTVLDDHSTGPAANLVAGAHLRRGSVLDPEAVSTAAAHARPDLVFHLASLVGMRLTTCRPSDSFIVSQQGTRNLLHATGDAPVVLFSSSAVYGDASTGENNRLHTQEQLQSEALRYDGGVRGYASGKLALENEGRQARQRGRAVLTVRPFNVVGPRQSSSYGAVLPAFLQCAAEGRPLTVYDDGQQRRTFADVRTFVATLMALVHSPAAWQCETTFDLGTRDSTTILELARLVLAFTSSNAGIRFVPYTDAFPGRTDVRSRLPHLQPVENLVGPVQWPQLPDILASYRAARQPPA
ncbi:MAG: NAD(P)-dependent oxidoreductase [Bryobacterales bacterium]|nr:NAD(P)-dependent oxidoreductase [Bryobacterales bacterium]